MPREFMIAGGGVILGKDLVVTSPGYIIVANGEFVEVGEGEPLYDGPRVDATGTLAIPGLINTHTHIGDSVAKDLGYGLSRDVNLLWQPNGLRHQHMAAVSRDELVEAMRRSVQQMIRTGTVAFADFREGGVQGIEALREACAGLPIAAVAFGRFEEYPLHSESVLSENAAGLSMLQLDELSATLELADGFSPLWANDTTDVGLRQISDRVRDSNKLIATHACETDRYRALSRTRTGTTDIKRIARHLDPDFVVHMTAATDSELEIAIDASIPIVMCTRTQAALGYGFPRYTDAINMGSIVGLGTDNVMVTSPDLLNELEFVSRASRAISSDPSVVSPEKLLASVTVNAAAMLGLGDVLGSISVGRSASFFLLDTEGHNMVGSVNPLAGVVDRATSGDVVAVFHEGVLGHANRTLRWH